MQNDALRPQLSFTDGLALVVGGAIGAGIFRTPGLVASAVGSRWLIYLVWTLGGVIALVGALIYAEMASRFPETGGQYIYVRRTLGSMPAFVMGWIDVLLSYGAAVAALSVAFGEFTVKMFGVSDRPARAVALGVLILLCLVHWQGLRAGARVQNVVTLGKVLALLAVIIIAFGPAAQDLVKARSAAAEAVTTPGGLALFAAFGVALQSVFFTYHGWAEVSRMAQEVRSAQRRLPPILILGTVTIVLLYLAINAAYLRVLSVGEIAQSKLVAADVMQRVVGSAGSRLVTGFALLAVFGGLNGILLYTPRLAYALAKDGMAPKWLARVNRGGTPVAALLFILAWSSLLITSGTFQRLIGMSILALWVGYTLVVIALFIERRRAPLPVGTYRAPGYPWLPSLFLAIAIAFLTSSAYGTPREALFIIGLMIAGAVVHKMVAWRHQLRRSS